MVIDGQVIASGPTLRSYPPKEDILRLCRRTGKWPFVFIHEAATVIEESTSAWHPTVIEGDAYPTIPVRFVGQAAEIRLVADLDTGAPGSFVDFDR